MSRVTTSVALTVTDQPPCTTSDGSPVIVAVGVGARRTQGEDIAGERGRAQRPRRPSGPRLPTIVRFAEPIESDLLFVSRSSLPVGLTVTFTKPIWSVPVPLP